MPGLDIAPLPQVFKQELLKRQPVAVWVTFFASVQETTFELSQDEAEEILRRTTSEVSFMPTPARKRLKVEPSQAGWQGLPGESIRPAQTFARLSPEGGTDPDAIVFKDWNRLVQTVEELQGRVPTTEEALQRLGKDTADLVSEVDAKVSGLFALSGQPSPQMLKQAPSPQLWGCIISLLNSVKDLDDRGTSLRSDVRSIVTGLQDTRKQLEGHKTSAQAVKRASETAEGLKDFVSRVYGELLKLKETSGAGSLSTEASDEISALRARLEDLESQNRSLVGAQERVNELLNRVEELEAESSGLKASLGGEIVKIDGTPFHDPFELEEWLSTHVGPDGVVDVWFDVVSMMETMLDVARGSDDQMDSQSRARKGGHESLLTGRIINSFATSIPQLFNSSAGEDFSKVPNYKAWNGRDGRTGMVPRAKKLLTIWERRHKAHIEQRLAGRPTALLLADKLLKNSMSFWSNLATWVDEFYGRLTSREGEVPVTASAAERKIIETSLKESREEAWNLIVKILDDLFQELAQRRAPGQPAQETTDKRTQAGCVLYGTLCAHKFMDELVQRSFERHPCMTPTFNAFLFLERASHTDLKRVDLRVEAVEKQAQGLQGKIDKLPTGKKS